ncbi:MAG: lysophospholipid acyltransferase family protein [Planctomycetes bacterium]|nr:lysophospholipid acyltransferase family protein [Planctomycetota bacterium]
MSTEPSLPPDAAEPPAQTRAAKPAKDHSYSAPLRAALGQFALRTAARGSLATLHAFGRAAGRVLASWPTRERLATRVNLAACFPELDAAARAELERASLLETGCTMAELAALWCWPGARVLELVREARGLEALDAARREHGALLLTPHLGAWELAGLFTGSRMPLTALYKAPRIREMEAFYTQGRERCGARLVPADVGGVRALHRALRAREVVGVLPDQDPGRGSGIFVPFFGVPANTTTLVAKLLQKHPCPLFLVWCERLPLSAGFRMHYVVARGDDLRSPDTEVAVRAMNRELEALIRSAPSQYLWSYKRFRNRPVGLRDPYRHGVADSTIGVRQA